MKIRTSILLCSCLLLALTARSQDAKPAKIDHIPQVRMQSRFIEITDKALKDLGLLQAFRKHVLPKGTVKDWYKVERACVSFRSVDAIAQSGQETFASSIVEVMLPESFGSSQISLGPNTRIEIPASPVFGEPRDDLGITLTFTPQTDQANRMINLQSHPKAVSLLGFHDRHHKSTIGKRLLASYPTPAFHSQESRSDIVLKDGETVVQTISYRGGKVPGHYRLSTATIELLPPNANKPKANIPAKKEGPLRAQELPIPRVAVTLERILVPSKQARAMDLAIGNLEKLQKLYDSGAVEVLSRMTTSTSSGNETFASDVNERMFPESFELMQVHTSEAGEASVTNSLTSLAPVFGQPRSDLGNTLTMTPQVSMDGNQVHLEIHPKSVSLIGTLKYSADTTLTSRKGSSETVKADCTTPIFASDEVRTSLTVRPGIPMLVCKTGHKNSPRIRTDKYIAIDDKKFVKLENSKLSYYVYTIVRADITNSVGGRK